MIMREKFMKAVNEYVAKYGYDVEMTIDELLAMADMSEKKGSLLPSDYCYNKFNAGLREFGSCSVLERVEGKKYRLLGENYPYNGPVLWKEKGTKVEVVVGRWKEGKYIAE